jgi:hypothetical protein
MEKYYSTPTWGQYADLLNQPLNHSLTKINDELFAKLGKLYLKRFGFYSVIYRHDEHKIWLKMYYYKSLIENDKREIEYFINHMYACEIPDLTYDECNLIHIPIVAPRDIIAINALNSFAETERYLQGLMAETDYISYNPNRHEGGTTWGSGNFEMVDYLRMKRLLFEGFLEPGYEDNLEEINVTPLSKNERGTSHSFYFNRPNYVLCVCDTQFRISWEFLKDGEQIEIPIKFKWKDVDFDLIVRSELTNRSLQVTAEINYFDVKAKCGFGIGTIGGGSIGKQPDIRIGNHLLVVNFGRNYVSLTIREIQFFMHHNTEDVRTDFSFFI